jgi:glycosyltransferase involved in cell wall biosynthesis
MLSVIIPVYNVLPYIDRCLESVMTQTNLHFEVLLINDGSTDGSDEKCVEWSRKDPRIRYISQSNQGPGPTRNLGVQLAGYDYVTFLDADDWWEPEYVALMLAAVCGYDADIAVCDMYYVTFDESGRAQRVISKLRLSDAVLNTRTEPDLLNKVRTFGCGKV